VAKIGLMGFGRIGRNVFRILLGRTDIRVGAVSDTADPRALEYLLRHDSILGPFPEDVRIRDGRLQSASMDVPMLAGEHPGEVPWGDFGVDTVIEATARYRKRDEIERHLAAGARRVILCIPPLDPPDITVIAGVNDDALRPEHRIVSNGSCTAQCAGPVLRALSEAFGVARAYLTTVHAYSSEQRLADVPTSDPRRGRAAAENIIPQTTNAAEMIEEIDPAFRGKLTGMAINVPVSNGSVVDLVCWHEKDVSADAVNGALREASTGRWKGLLAFESDPIVSRDVWRSSASGTVDSLSTMVLGKRMSKTLTFYDNGWGYSHRAVDLVGRFARFDGGADA
jgi:glyceraldehyde 3-phosphate dehydrogenase